MSESENVPSIRVEFYGVARLHARMDVTTAGGTTLGEILRSVRDQHAACSRFCEADGRLAKGYLANLNGRTFVVDPGTVVSADDVLLILSADVGG